MSNPKVRKFSLKSTTTIGTKIRKKTSLSSRHQSIRSEIEKVRRSLYSQRDFDFLKATDIPATLENPNINDQRLWIIESGLEFLNTAFNFLSKNQSNQKWMDICSRPSGGFPEGSDTVWRDVSGEIVEGTNAFDYVEEVFGWVEEVFEDEERFPTDGESPYPDEVDDIMKRMYYYVLTMHAILRLNPVLLTNLNEVKVNAEFKFFLFFSWRWNLLEMKADKVKIVEAMLKPYKDEYKRDVLAKHKAANKGLTTTMKEEQV